MEGLEGLKILSEKYDGGWDFGFIFILSLLVILGIVFCIGGFIAEEMSLTALGVIILALVICGIIQINTATKYKVLKVTPIQDKYYIDLNKWEIINTEDEIMTIKEKVK